MKDTLAFHDPADLPQASAEDNPIDHAIEALCPRCNHAVDAVCPNCSTPVEASGADISGFSKEDFYRRIITLVLTSRNAKFTLTCFLIAIGDGFADGTGITDVARRWGVTKATVSKHCRRVCVEFGIRPSPYMLREDSIQKFRISNRRPAKVA